MGTIVILTGAGISAESGIQTFRGAGGLWEGHRVEDVATPEAFQRDPELVQNFYNMRRQDLLDGIEPNDAHRALAKLANGYDGRVVLVTQNIDDLHERGGSPDVWHMHGELLKARCVECESVQECRGNLGGDVKCGACGVRGGLRPQIVWFGEMPLYMPKIELALVEADLFVSIGTSGQVYPAAGFVELARHGGARTVEINLEQTGASGTFHECLTGKAGEVLPGFVEAILLGQNA
jgi:NAD-dependent deacetylase